MGVPEIRSFPQITSDLIASVVTLAPQVTDFVEGAVLRTICEALCIELQRNDFTIFDGVKTGTLVGTYQNFSFNRLSATPASGTVRFTRSSGTGTAVIPANTQVQVPGSSTRIYKTNAAIIYIDGQTVADMGVLCLTAGTGGNTPANTVVELVGNFLGFGVTLTNLLAFTSGLEQETEESRKRRFQLYIAGLSKATREAILFAALSTQRLDTDGSVIERVTAAYVREPYLETPRGRLGRVEVYIDNGSATATQALLDLVKNVIRGYVDLQSVIQRGYIAAGLDLFVYAAQALPLTVTGTITLEPGSDPVETVADVQEAVVSYLQGLQVFQVAVLAEIVTAAMEVQGVIDFTLTAPTSNTFPKFNQRVIPGAITILT